MGLKEKVKTYERLIESSRDKYGFIEWEHCDSLLFTSLLGCVPSQRPSIYRARAGQQWFRRPVIYRSCLSDGWDRTTWERIKECLKARSVDPDVLKKIFDRGSSTISRDMLLGLAWYAFHKKQLYVSESVIRYALKNRLIMGSGTISRTFLGLGLLSTFAWISYRLGGPSRPWLRWIPWESTKGLGGFQAHLQVLHALLRRQVTGKDFKSTFSHYATKQQRNPLFLIANGEFSKAKEVLMCECYWPNDRLPTSEDRKTEWLPMRDEGDDWKPSEAGRTHSGGDLLFLAWLMEFEQSSGNQ